MAELPMEIVEQILVKLDVKDLIRCRIVAKSWKDLIFAPNFIKSHLEHSYLRDHDNSQIGNRRIVISDIPKFMRRYQDARSALDFQHSQLYLIGSSNGLVCVSRPHDEVIVINPETREVRKFLPNPGIRVRGPWFYGFGYDSKIDDYKVVFGFKTSNGGTCFNMLTLKSNIWEVIEEVDYTATGPNFRSIGILYNGSLHWVAYHGNQVVIITFDLSDNKFKEIPQPDDVGYKNDIGEHRKICLGIMDDCFCVFQSKMVPDNIWMMSKYGVKESWERVGPERKIKAEIVHRLKMLQQYIPNSKSLCQERWVSQNTEFIGSPLYIPSLVSPHVVRIPKRKRKRRAKRRVKCVEIYWN